MNIVSGRLRRLVPLGMGALLLASTASSQVVGPNFMVAVPPTGFENEPAVVVQGSHLLAAWRKFGPPKASASRDGGATWQDVSGIPWEGTRRTPVTICAGDSGRFYLVAPTFILGPGYEAIEAYEGKFVGTMFQWRRLANPVPTPYGATDEPKSMAVQFDPVSRNLYLTFTKVRLISEMPSVLTHLERYFVALVRSTDGGQSWDPAIELTGPESAGPKLAVGTAGELSVIWKNYALGKLMGRRSSDFGASFGPEVEVTPINESVMAPTEWRGNHNHKRPPLLNGVCYLSPPGFALAVDRSPGPRRGTWYLATAEQATGTIGPMSSDRSEVEPNDTYASAGPIGIGEDVTGSVSSSKHDGDDVDYLTFTGEAGQTIWLGVSSSPGEPFSSGLVCGNDPSAVIGVSCMDATAPAAIYTLPTTGRYYTGAGLAGPGSSGYRLQLREFTVDPSSVARDHRDVLLKSSTDGGVTWSLPTRVTDGPVGSEESFPEVVVDDEGRVHVGWYDQRGADCGAETNVYWTYSDDGGQTFIPAVRVSEQSSFWDNINNEVGDRIGLAAEGGKAYMVWTGIPPSTYADIIGAVISDIPTAVLVSGLRAEERDRHVVLRWWAGDVRAVREFRMHRATGAADYVLVATIAARTNGEYRWDDTAVLPGTRYRYRLEAVPVEGASVWEGPIEVSVALSAARMTWQGAVPNPFAETVELQLETPDRSATRITVFDVSGHEVVELRGEAQGNRLVVHWNGRDRSGRVVAPGVYLVRAQLGARSVMRQIVRMK